MFDSIRGPSSPTHPLSTPLWLLTIFVGIQAACSVSQFALSEYRIRAMAAAFQPFGERLKEAGEALDAQGKQLQDASERLAPHR